MRSDLFSLNLWPFFKVSICSDGANENFKNLPSEKKSFAAPTLTIYAGPMSMMHFQHNPRKNIFCFLCLKEYSQMMFCHFCSASDEKLMSGKLQFASVYRRACQPAAFQPAVFLTCGFIFGTKTS